jgi:glycosyltransferase involved in cell wall biosynthesis
VANRRELPFNACVDSRRILLLITDLEIGGTPTVVRELAIRLHCTHPDIQIHVACLSKWGPVADQLTAAGIPVTALAAVGPYDFRILPRLIALIRNNRFDTVFSFLVHANTLAAAASLWVRDVRWIQSVQTTQPRPRWHWHAQHFAARAADAVVVPSPSVAIAAANWSGIPREKIVVIPNAIDPADFEKSPIPSDDPRPYPITFIGRLDPIKDVPNLIAAVAQLQGLAHLHIYGDGSDRPRIEAEIARQNLAANITLHGSIACPQIALAQSGLLVLPSLAEGFGLVLIEAMAAAVPIVASNVPGIADVIHPDQTGLLVPPSNPTALAAAIRRIITDHELRARLITAATNDLQQRFTWDVALKQYQALLRL